MDLQLDDFVVPVESPVAELAKSFKKNYEELEKLALDTVNHCSVPCFNVLQDLTKSECQSILKNNFWKFKPVLERAVLLSILTDYIACSYSNSALYQTFERKSDRKSIYSLCIILNSHWCDVFRDCTTTAGIEESQIISALKILKDSVKRLENNTDCFFRESYQMAERAMEKLKIMSFLQSPMIQSSPKSAAVHKKSNISHAKMDGHIKENVSACIPSVNNHSDNKEKSVLVSSVKSCEKPDTTPLKNIQVSSNSPVSSKPGVISTKPSEPIKPAVQPVVKTKPRENIMRYFKKPSEISAEPESKLTENESSKENIMKNIELTTLPCLDLCKDESSPELYISPERKRTTSDSPMPDSPVKKKVCGDILSDGRKNVFAILMKNSRNNSSKRKSLFT